MAERAVAWVVVNVKLAASFEDAAQALVESLVERSSRKRRPRASAVDMAAYAVVAYEAAEEEAASCTAAGGDIEVAIAELPGSGVEVEACSTAEGDHTLHTGDGAATAAWVAGIHDTLVVDLARDRAADQREAYPAAACWGS